MEELLHRSLQAEQKDTDSPPSKATAFVRFFSGKRPKKDKVPRKKLWFARHKVLTVLLALAVIAAFLLYKIKFSASKAAANGYQYVRTTTLSKTSLENSVTVTGTVASGSVASVTVSDNAKTYKVSEVNVAVGDHVNTGDVIAKLDTADLEKSIANATTSFNDTLQAAQLSYTRAKDSYDTAITRHDNTLIDLQTKIDQAEEALSAAQDEQKRAEDSYNSAKSNVDSCSSTVGNLQSAYEACTTQVNTAKAAYDAAVDALASAAQSLNDAGRSYTNAYLTYMGTNQSDTSALDTAKSALESAALTLESAWAAYGSGTITTLTPSTTNARTVAATTAPTIAEANAQLTSIGLSLSAPTASGLIDAYNTGTDALITAESSATTAANGKTYDQIINDYTTAQNALTSAQKELTQAETARGTADKSVESAGQSVKSAKSAYDEEKNYSTLKNLKQSLEDAATQLTQARRTPDTLTTLQSTLADCTLTATASGTVTALNATVGSACTATVATIQDTEGLTVEVTIPANEVTNVSTGMTCYITSDSTGDSQISGTLTQIDPVANDKGTFGAKVTVNGDSENLKIGMQAQVEILQNQTDDVFAVPTDAIATAEDGACYVYRKTGGEGTALTFEEVTVTTGASNDYYTEISGDDLKEGDVIRSSADLTQGIETSGSTDSSANAFGGAMMGIGGGGAPADGDGAMPGGGAASQGGGM